MDGSAFSRVADESSVGTYPAHAKAGGGYVWDEVLEYRVWCHAHDGAPDVDDGNDYYRAFASYEEALEFGESTPGAEEPVALVLQEKYIDEPEAGEFEHLRERRITEWPVRFLTRPRRMARTIPNFIASDAPNPLDVLRGLA